MACLSFCLPSCCFSKQASARTVAWRNRTFPLALRYNCEHGIPRMVEHLDMCADSREAAETSANSSAGWSSSTGIVCFRCGICCVRYQVLVTETEARDIVRRLGITWQQWLDRYINPAWPGTDSFIIRQVDGACIFLENSSAGNTARCVIHPFRPVSCREWAPGLDQRECREGLSRYWELTVAPSGQIEGTRDKLGDFRSFLESLASERDTGSSPTP